jgi:hypothetical protein
MPRNSINRKYRPGFENLESKQLLSAGLLAHGVQPVMQTSTPVSSQAEHQGMSPDGTGTGLVIITS